MEELCQPSLNGRGGPVAPIAIQATNFVLKNYTIQQVQNSFQFHGLSGDDANKHLDKFLHVNQQVKAVTPSCETCGGPHSYTNCPASVGQTQNVYVVGAYQGASHGQNPPPAYQAPAYQASGYQALVHQPPIPQPQVVTTNEFTNFMKANDAVLKNMQTNMTSLTNSNLKLKNMLGQFMKMNTDSSSGSGTLPGNTVTNSKEELKGITTRSGTAYQGPMIPTTSSSLPNVVERETEATKDTVPPTKNGSTKDVQPPVVQIETPILNYEPIVAPVSAPRPNQKPSIPYPSRLHDQKLRDKANEQKEKFFKIFQDLNFKISFADALILMPKFGPSIKSLLTNKDKLYELARTPLNEHCLVVLLKKLPEKLGDPTSFSFRNYLPQVQKELKICEAKTDKSSIDEPPELKLKDLPPHLEYAFLEGNDKLPIIIAKDLSIEEKAAPIMVLKLHKRAIAWKLSDIKGIDPEFCTHKILMEEDFEPAVQHQRRVNPKIHDVIKQEVLKLLDVELIYPIFDSPWVSLVHCVPKKGGFTVVKNKENELIPTRLVTRWRVCIDYHQEKTTFTCPYGTFAYRRMPFGLCNAPGTFQRNLFPPLDNPELTIRRRSRTDRTILNEFEMATKGNGDPPVPDLRTMVELCQPSLNGRGGLIAPISIQETNFGLKNDMIQQVLNSCQFHGLPGDDANKHLDKFLHVTQSIKVNGVADDALRLYLFPHSLTHHATAWRQGILSIHLSEWPKCFLENIFHLPW
nr:reverse transcriptase domain-containing protein [Tanacetum cinerariifolium]